MPKTKLHAFTSVSFRKSRGFGDFKSNSLVDGGDIYYAGKNKGEERLKQSRGGQEGFQMQDTVDQERGLGWRCETGSHCSIEHIKIRDYMRLPGSSGAVAAIGGKRR